MAANNKTKQKYIYFLNRFLFILLELLQMLPNEFQDCAEVQTVMEKMVKKITKVIDLKVFMKDVAINLTFHSFAIMGAIAQGMQGYNENDFYKFGYGLGKALDLLIQ